MRTIFSPVALLILVACSSSPNSDNGNQLTPHQQAILLKDSAVHIMHENSDQSSYDGALNLLDQALAKDPQLKSAYFYKMRLYTKMDDDEGYFNTMVASDKNIPGDPYSALHLGMQYEKRDNPEKAHDKYVEAIGLFESQLDTLSIKNPLIRNTFIMNLALANTLAGQDIDPDNLKTELSEPEKENLNIVLNTLKSMTREDLLNLQK